MGSYQSLPPLKLFEGVEFFEKDYTSNMGSSTSTSALKKDSTWEYFELPCETLRLRVMKGERNTLVLQLWGLSKNCGPRTIWVRIHPPEGQIINPVNGKTTEDLEPEARRVAQLIRDGKITDANVVVAGQSQ
jgi:hypothetical protein